MRGKPFRAWSDEDGPPSNSTNSAFRILAGHLTFLGTPLKAKAGRGEPRGRSYESSRLTLILIHCVEKITPLTQDSGEGEENTVYVM